MTDRINDREVQTKLETWTWADIEIREELIALDRSSHKLDDYEKSYVENVCYQRKNEKLTRAQREFALRTFMKYAVDLGD